MNETTIAAWLVGITGVLVAVIREIKSVLEGRSKSSLEQAAMAAKAKLEETTATVKARQEEQAREFSESQIILDRQEKHIDRLEKQIDEHQKAILELYSWCMRKDADYETLRAWGLQMEGIVTRYEVRLRKAGLPIEDTPLMPSKASRAEGSNDPGFIMRTAAQDAKVANEATKIIEAAAAEKKR